MTPHAETTRISGYDCRTHRRTAADGTALFYRRFVPHGHKPTGRLDLIHGWADHSGRYPHLLGALRPLNLDVWVPDLRGHGNSGGRRGHIHRFDDYLRDLAKVFGLTDAQAMADAPRWLLGHSMGGLVAFYLALRYPAHYQGVILSSPFMAPNPALNTAKRCLASVLSATLPALPLRKAVAPQGISHDPEAIKCYRDDPLVHGCFTPRWLNEIVGAQAVAPQEAARLDRPLLMQLSPDDTVVEAQASLAVYLRLPAGAKTLRVYPKRGHELYNETSVLRSKPLKDLVDWIGTRQEAWLLEHLPA